MVGCGTSGVSGRCPTRLLLDVEIGGADDMVERLQPIWEGGGARMGDHRTHPGRTVVSGAGEEEGWPLLPGPSGAGHLRKMVHNGTSSTAWWRPTARARTSGAP